MLESMLIMAARLVNLIPRFRNLTIQRVWRGLHSMTPDGAQVVGKAPRAEDLLISIGMRGRGFVLDPGVGMDFASLAHHERSAMEP